MLATLGRRKSCVAIIAIATIVSSLRAAPIDWSADRSVVPCGKGFIVTHDGRVLCWSTRNDGGRINLRLHESRDFGRTFSTLPAVVDFDDDPRVDMGDASMLETRDGALWIAYRVNHTRGTDAPRPRYSIRAAQSLDGGKTWKPTTVAESRGTRGQPSRGLWASFLFERSDGAIQVYYDDEDRPFPAGKPGHQWITMRTWNAAKSAWADPITAARAHDASKLSRDGMMSVVELAPNKLLMAFESVQTDRPHANVVRSVTSDDGGATWSWSARERSVLYEPPAAPYMALAPWMTRLADGRLICVFCTDEDRTTPAVSGTPAHQMKLDVKYVLSTDNGQTWSASQPLAIDTHHYYLPGIASRTVDGKTELLAMYLDFADGKCKAVRGTIPPRLENVAP